ncbi:14682_t:CDS:10 [Acaulospora morrowiae]|uniref:HECT-type E3 ubiquitin transferase n=1 Tax=Acaulospora morrowiae TaxID=94023 RepID=A0A9N8W058_9GLOM|nr:14682_t:CDS:10 [Acaulospora morrowiae]
MFNSFEGNYKSKRSINLGGQKKQEDKEALVRNTQEQRRARDIERLKKKSAAKIQAFFRGRTVTRNLRDQERASWDQQAEFILRSDIPRRDVATTLINLVRSFLFFYRPLSDGQRELCLCNILRKQNLDLEIIFVPFYYEDLRNVWAYQLKKVLLIFLRSVGSNSIYDKKNVVHYLEALMLTMDVKKYGSSGQSVGGRETAQGILEYLKTEDKNNPATRSIANLSVHPFHILASTHPIYQLALQDFITHIFTISSLPSHLSKEALIIFSRRTLYDLILRLSTIPRNNWNAEQASILLSNLVVFTHRIVKQMSNPVFLAYLTVLQNLSLQIPIRSLLDKSSAEVIVNDDDSDDDIITEGRPETSLVKIDPVVLKRISYMFDRQYLISVFEFSKDSNYATFLKVTNFLLTLMIRWPSKKTELLNNMTYGALSTPEIRLSISLIWEAFKKSDLANLLPTSQSIPLNYFTDSTYSEQWGMFALLCELFSQILLIMGDDEFFDEGRNPLRLSEIVDISTCLKNVGFTLYWNSPSLKMDLVVDGGCISFIYLRDTVTKLLRQIHARDSRRRFTSPDHWLMISESEISTFAKTVVDEDQELERDQEKNNVDKRQRISISPRLGILYSIPFVIPFDERVKIFRQFVRNDRERSSGHHPFFEPRTHVTIRRNHVFEDGYAHLNAAGARLKNSVGIQFIDEFGIQEAGIDGGGLFKEFLTSLTRIAFDTNFGLFLSTKEQLLYPNPQAYARQDERLNYYEFIGRILGKALYEGILVDAAFAGFFLSKWLGRTSYLDDLPSLDPELYQGLIILKNYKGNVESDLSLNFTVVDDEFGEQRTIELEEGGSDIPVTNENRIRYIYLMANYRLNKQIERQCKSFFRGLSDLIKPKWLRMFNQVSLSLKFDPLIRTLQDASVIENSLFSKQQELQILVGGAYIPINLEDLRRNTVYAEYKDDDPVIIHFWKVVSEFSEEQKQKLIKFVTSCSRPPLLGFKELNPKFSIRRAGSGTRLPSSSTCVNLLKLPAYPDEDTLREKLSYAINADVGFDLS